MCPIKFVQDKNWSLRLHKSSTTKTILYVVSQNSKTSAAGVTIPTKVRELIN